VSAPLGSAETTSIGELGTSTAPETYGHELVIARVVDVTVDNAASGSLLWFVTAQRSNCSEIADPKLEP
jgi:hypothetical protein